MIDGLYVNTPLFSLHHNIILVGYRCVCAFKLQPRRCGKNRTSLELLLCNQKK